VIRLILHHHETISDRPEPIPIGSGRFFKVAGAFSRLILSPLKLKGK